MAARASATTGFGKFAIFGKSCDLKCAAEVERLKEKARERQKAHLKQYQNDTVTQLIEERGDDRNLRTTDATRARMAGTNRRYLHDAERIFNEHPEQVDAIRAAMVEECAAEVERLKEKARERQKANAPQKGQQGFQSVVTQLIGEPQEDDRHARETDATRARLAGTNRQYVRNAHI